MEFPEELWGIIINFCRKPEINSHEDFYSMQRYCKNRKKMAKHFSTKKNFKVKIKDRNIFLNFSHKDMILGTRWLSYSFETTESSSKKIGFGHDTVFYNSDFISL